MRALLVLLVVAGCEDGTIDGPLDENPPPFAEPNVGCAKACHGSETTNAPPVGIGGVTETTDVGVGAHRVHVQAAPDWHRRVECADCHVVPMRDDDPGHIDGDNKAELTFSMIAGTGSTWNGTTCTAYCHGRSEWGGTHTTPTWTQVDGTQATCGSCHGAPPPPPHPAVADNNCAACHPTMEENSLTFRDPASHINGKVDLVDASQTGGCTACHGMTNAAPPRDLAGGTARTSPGVGAHQQHLGSSTWHRTVACSDCHTVPQTQSAPGHIDGDNNAEIVFSFMNPAGTYDAAATTCRNMYCHGNGRGNNGVLSWLTQGTLACGGCHRIDGQNMSGDHQDHLDKDLVCADCHSTVVDGNMTIINASAHVNGVHDVKMAQGTWNPATRQCANSGCHNTRTW